MALITNLIKSSAFDTSEIEEKKDEKSFSWLSEYLNSKDFEIYRVRIPGSYAGTYFYEIVNNVYKQNELLLFALEISVNKKQGEILLNPGNYRLPKPYSWNNEYEYFGYIVAGSKEDAEEVFAEDYQNEAN